MKRLVTSGLVALALAATGFGLASAQSDRAIERSGNVFHVQVCPEHGQPGVVRCHAHIVTDANGNGKTVNPNGKPNFSFQGYYAQDLWAAYGITSWGTSATTIAIVDAYGYANAEHDLGIYRSAMGLPACTSAGPNPCFTKVDQGGSHNYPGANIGWAQEQALDLDMVSAMCPNCRILLVQSNDASYGNITAAVTYAAAHAQIVSNSYGSAENGTSGFAGAYNHPGVTMTVSSGDSGYGTQFPASVPTVVAVGGTSLNQSGGAYSETAWSGAGSGCSVLFAQPGYQSGVVPAGCSMRMVADVSAVADPNTGVRVFAPSSSTASNWYLFGGTSVAAPIIAGIYGSSGTGNGVDHLYLFGNASNLHDVTSGSNGRCRGVPTYFCNAVGGYDGPTGLGTPNGTGAF